MRFTSPQQEHLILGTSRAAQGVRPEFMASGAFYNFSFTLLHSPYGQMYREAIEQKIKLSEGEGKFVLTIDPWSISGLAEDPEDESLFKDSKTRLANVGCKSCCPNYEYLLKYYPKGWGRLILRKIRNHPSHHTLHEDGWLEIDIPMDSISVYDRTVRKMKVYERNSTYYAPSDLRFSEFEKLVDTLSNKGQVYIVRLPVPSAMKRLESQYMPKFEQKIQRLVENQQLPYLDMTLLPDTFRYIDGNHLYSASSTSVSKIIDDFIRRADFSE
ncbi:MAG: hypothetical protein HKN79_01825 [Flavobacteriales bacterium]|nr:hypothetical protein [Flavobacteriales bacterium]